MALDRYDAHRQRKAVEPHPIPASDVEQVAIMRAVFATHRLEGRPLPPPEPNEVRGSDSRVLLLLDSAFLMLPCFGDEFPCQGPDSVAANRLWSDDFELRDFPVRLRRELVMANTGETPFMPDPGVPDARLVSRRPATGWEELYRANPDVSGILKFSRAVLSANGTTALIYSDIRCGDLCGTGYVFLLRRQGDGWVVVEDHLLWIS